MAYYAKFINELNSDVKFVLRQHNVESTIFERAVKEENNFAKKCILNYNIRNYINMKVK